MARVDDAYTAIVCMVVLQNNHAPMFECEVCSTVTLTSAPLAHCQLLSELKRRAHLCNYELMRVLQWLELGSGVLKTADWEEVLWFALLGAILEGALNPWWQGALLERTAGYGRGRVLRFALTTLVWTPICCGLAFAAEHLLFNGQHHLDLRAAAQSLVDGAETVRAWLADSISTHAGGFNGPSPDGGLGGAPVAELLQEEQGDLAEDVEWASTWQVVSSSLSRMLPAPLRPLAKRLASAGSWTVLDQLEP